MSRELSLWGAKGPDGTVVRSSIGTFRSVAQRFALRKKNYEVVRLGSVSVPYLDESPSVAAAMTAPEMKAVEQESKAKRGPGRPRKIKETEPTKKKLGRPRKQVTA